MKPARNQFFPRRSFLRRQQVTGAARVIPFPRLSRSSAYAAAGTTRLTGSWSPADTGINDLIKASAPAVRARVRQLVRDFPYFARAVNVLVDYVVGPGIVLQSKVARTSGALNIRAIQQIEDAWSRWCEQADVAGRLHLYEIMRLAKRQDVEPGEFIPVMASPRGRNRYLPFALQMYEADWLTESSTNLLATGSEISQGVEYSKSTGEVLAYHFTDPDGWGKSTVRVPANLVIHGFDTVRPGQLRGISPFAPGVLLAADLQNIMDSEIDASKMASKYLAMITTPDAAAFQFSRGYTDDPTTGQRIEELENAVIEYLQPGEDIKLASNPRPGSNFPPFVRLILTMFSVTAGVPYELLSGDYQGMNYSTGKMIRNDFSNQLKPAVQRHIRQFCQPVYRAFLDAAVLAGKVSLPGYWTDPLRYQACDWQPPGMESIDPLRETKARIDEIKLRIRSPMEIIKSRGRDPEAVVQEVAEFERLCERYGVTTGEEVSTATANNPAAVMEEQR